MNTATKDCPLCGETIKAIAKKCRHCGEFIDQIKEKNDSTEKSFQPKFPAFFESTDGYFKFKAPAWLLSVLGMLLLPFGIGFPMVIAYVILHISAHKHWKKNEIEQGRTKFKTTFGQTLSS